MYLTAEDIAEAIYSDEIEPTILEAIDLMDDDEFCDFLEILERQHFDSASCLYIHLENNMLI